MSADIFGRRLHADIDALIQRTVKTVVSPHVLSSITSAPALMRYTCDGGNVGHFEGLRTRRPRPGSLWCSALNNSATPASDQGIEIGRLDNRSRRANPSQKFRRRAVGVIARPGDDRRLSAPPAGVGGNCRQARGRNPNARALAGPSRAISASCSGLGGRPFPRRPILVLAAVGMQIFRRRIKHGGAVDDPAGLTNPFLRLGVASRGHQRGSRPSVASMVRRPLKNSCARRRRQKTFFAAARQPPVGGFRAGLVNNRTQKTPVNPLTRLRQSFCDERLFSRSTLRGLPATFDPLLSGPARHTACQAAFAAMDRQGLAPSAYAMISKRCRNDP